jgi:hypothetical protein
MPHIGALDFNMLMAPDHYDCRILPTAIKQSIVDKILDHINWLKDNNAWTNIISQYENLITYLEQSVDDKAIRVFREKTLRLDAIRNESFLETFPEYKEIFNDN